MTAGRQQLPRVLGCVLILLPFFAKPLPAGETNDALGAWHSLFDGQTFSGWKAVENPSSWTIQNGAMVAQGPRAHLFYVGNGTDATYRNLELKVEVTTAPGSNSGIYIHTQVQDSDWPNEGIEVQVNNSYATDPRRTGSLVGVVAVRESPVKDDDWWTQHIIVNDKRVLVKLNGETVVDYTEPAEGDVDRRLGEGLFALQAHDPKSVMKFRNIRARRLSPGLGAGNGKLLNQLKTCQGTGPSDVRATIEYELELATPQQLRRIEEALLSVLILPDATETCRQFAARVLHRIASAQLRQELAKHTATPMVQAILDGVPDSKSSPAPASRPQKRKTTILLQTMAQDDWPGALAAAESLPCTNVPAILKDVDAALTSGTPQARIRLGDALLRWVRVMARAGAAQAASLASEHLLDADLPSLLRIAFLRERVQLDAVTAAPRLAKIATGADPTLATEAQILLVKTKGQKVTEEAATQLPTLPPYAQRILIPVLVDRGDTAAVPRILDALQSPDRDVRFAALAALRALASTTELPPLVAYAATTQRAEREEACSVIAELRGPDLEDKLQSVLADPDAGKRAVAVQALVARGGVQGQTAVFTAVLDTDKKVRKEALKLLPDVATTETIPRIITLLPKLKKSSEKRKVQQALLRICTDDDAKEVGAQGIVAVLRETDTDPGTRIVLLGVLGKLGVPSSLEAVRDATGDTDKKVVDAAARALCAWPSNAAIPALWPVAEKGSETHKVLAVRALLRLLALPSERAPAETVAAYRRILGLAPRAQEKTAVIARLGDMGTVDAVNTLAPLLKDDETREATASVLKKLAGSEDAAVRTAAEAALRNAP